jgi:hypothetical protein
MARKKTIDTVIDEDATDVWVDEYETSIHLKFQMKMGTLMRSLSPTMT